jgi:TonB family protein
MSLSAPPPALVPSPFSSVRPEPARTGFGGAWAFSLFVHATAAVALLMFSYWVRLAQDKPAEFTLEQPLLAGVGADLSATEAPAGSEAGLAATGAINFNLPPMPAPAPLPTPPPSAPAPVTAVLPAPVEPAPIVKSATAIPETPPPDIAKQIQKTVAKTVQQTKSDIKKQQAAQAKAEQAAAKAAAEAAKKVSYSEHVAAQGNKANPAATARPAAPTGATAKPGPRIDAASIKRGVTGGTGAQSEGQGGNALTVAERDQFETYVQILLSRIRDNHVPPAGLSDYLTVKVAMLVAANGTISNARVLQTSGDRDFDESVLDAVRRVSPIGPRPDRQAKDIVFTFRLKE